MMHEKTPEPGIYYATSFSEYQSWKAYNPSTIKVLLEESCLAMRHVMTHGSESSDDMDLGKAAHHAVFEPGLFEHLYAVWQQRRAGKAYDEFCEKHANQHILSLSEYADITAIRDAVRSHAEAAAIINAPGQAEVSIVWVDHVTGALCKGRTDWFRRQHRAIDDLKTCTDSRPFAFIKQVVKYGYHISMGAYIDGLQSLGEDVSTATFIVADKKPWHDVAVYELAPQALRIGMERWHYGLSRALECERTGRWPGHTPCVTELNLPEWAIDQAVPEPITIGGASAFEEND